VDDGGGRGRDLAFENEGDEAQATPTRAGKRVDIVDTLQQRGPVDAAEEKMHARSPSFTAFCWRERTTAST
jgi:hypothetical protein